MQGLAPASLVAAAIAQLDHLVPVGNGREGKLVVIDSTLEQPGQVLVERVKTLFVAPDPAVEERLRDPSRTSEP